MERTLFIQPRDPAIFRDGRPFNAGLPARSMSWPMPSAIIGAIRTRLGRLTNYDSATVQRLERIEHQGPFLAVKQGTKYTLAFPAPADAVAFNSEGGRLEILPLRPQRLSNGQGTDLPDQLSPLLIDRDEKPAEMPAFWFAERMMEWLAVGGKEPVFHSPAEIGFRGLTRQRRLHVKIESGSQAAEKGMLFATEGLEFPSHVLDRDPKGWRFEEPAPTICSRIRYGDEEDWPAFEQLAPLGGERRLAYWGEREIEWPSAPDWLADSRFVRLQLVTPGCFGEGWRPEWMSHGIPPGLDDLELNLVAAAVPRAAALSGWDFAKAGGHSQKATRFLAPAGSVYFCEVKRGDPRRLWMKSIADKKQDRHDGFGLVLCGVWQWR